MNRRTRRAGRQTPPRPLPGRAGLPHLIGCMENLSPTAKGKGMCFHRSAALVLDLRGAEVVIGTVRAARPDELEWIPNGSTTPFIHCWVEYGGAVLAPTLIERMDNTLTPLPREDYYRANDVRDTYRLTRQQLLQAAAGAGLSAHLKRGVPLTGGRSVGAILLAAAGVPHHVDARGGVFPIQHVATASEAFDVLRSLSPGDNP